MEATQQRLYSFCFCGFSKPVSFMAPKYAAFATEFRIYCMLLTFSLASISVVPILIDSSMLVLMPAFVAACLAVSNGVDLLIAIGFLDSLVLTPVPDDKNYFSFPKFVQLIFAHLGPAILLRYAFTLGTQTFMIWIQFSIFFCVAWLGCWKVVWNNYSRDGLLNFIYRLHDVEFWSNAWDMMCAVLIFLAKFVVFCYYFAVDALQNLDIQIKGVIMVEEEEKEEPESEASSGPSSPNKSFSRVESGEESESREESREFPTTQMPSVEAEAGGDDTDVTDEFSDFEVLECEDSDF